MFNISAIVGKLQWIGATDQGHEGKWTWTNGVAVAKSHWYPGEPNDKAGGQNCALINWWKSGFWADETCTTKHPFHCQVAKSA